MRTLLRLRGIAEQKPVSTCGISASVALGQRNLCPVSPKARCMDWKIFACISIGAAAAGIGIVMAASRIERERRARHAERFGKH
jgi:hypothetical protein